MKLFNLPEAYQHPVNIQPVPIVPYTVLVKLQYTEHKVPEEGALRRCGNYNRIQSPCGSGLLWNLGPHRRYQDNNTYTVRDHLHEAEGR